MKKLNVLSLAALVCLSLITAQQARAANNEADVRKMLDDWNKAFRAKDVDAIMSFYVRGNDLKAFDIVAPLQIVGSDSYRKNYETFLAMYE